MRKYTYEKALEASLNYFNQNELAAKVFVDKYALKDKEGNVLEDTPEKMHRRLAKEFVRIEKKYPNPMSEGEIFGLLDQFKFIVPQGSPMSGIGNPYSVQSVGNCFVIESPYDSYGGILKSDQELVQLAKRRAGIGFDISNLRPQGMPTKNAAKTTDGIGVFMERFSNSCREVAQSGRRGALLLSISCHHPEIRTFINIKRNLKKVTGANISVRMTNEFMTAVEKGEKVQLRFPVDSKKPEVEEWVDAKELWNELIQSNWESAEPGLLFWDTVVQNSTADIYAGIDPSFKTTSTNPCGEIPMGQDSCRLLLINLKSFVKNPFTTEASFDWEKYSEIIQKAQRLMDDLVDYELECIDRILEKINSDPEPDNVKRIETDMWKNFRRTCEMGRRTGLGITAAGDAVAALNVRYGSEESIELIEKIYKTLALNAHESSCILAKERGAFPLFDYSLEEKADCPYLKRVWKANPEIKELAKKYGRRNICLTTTAPAGSVSILTQTTSGIEPAFLLTYKRRKKVNPSDKNVRIDFVDQLGDSWQEFDVHHHGFQEWMNISGKTKIEDSPYHKATSNDIDWINKVKIQAVAQKWVSHAISNTTNVPSNTSVDTIKEIYMTAYKHKCKGATVYRDGCRSGVLVSEETYNKQQENNREKNKFTEHHAPKRPAELPCNIHQVNIKGEAWTILVGLMDNKLYELFVGLSEFVEIPKKFKTGKIIKHPRKKIASIYDLVIGEGEDQFKVKDIVKIFNNPSHSSITRLLSLSLRHGTSVQFIVEQLQKDENEDIFDFSRVVARVLKSYIKDGTKATGSCKECGSEKIVFQEGCVSCLNCGFSKCS